MQSLAVASFSGGFCTLSITTLLEVMLAFLSSPHISFRGKPVIDQDKEIIMYHHVRRLRSLEYLTDGTESVRGGAEKKQLDT